MGAIEGPPEGGVTFPFKAPLRSARYALPGLIERHMSGETASEAARSCVRLSRSGVAISAAYFHSEADSPAAVAEAFGELARELARSGCEAQLALKAPALAFDERLVRTIAAEGVPLMFDSLTEPHAAGTLALAQAVGAGIAIPARWRRSAADADALRDRPCRIRLIKGEWSDPAGDPPDCAAAFLQLAGMLAGRGSPVGVATHDPALADAALRLLLDAGTPCELEQLRGLPRRRTTAVARRLGVSVRLYYPFGPGWWPYAVDKALARPYLPLWAVRDLIGA